jgi:pimeloyl-ACP methyl ester carboxylesterase
MNPAGAAPVAREIVWDVDGRQVAGQSWGQSGQRPVLALHGWLDNSASFATLGPALAGCHVVAPDLCGHGRSGHRSPDGGYQIWDDLPDLLAIVDDLGWDRFSLIGHSRGAIIAALLASVLGSRVGRLVLLDAVLPEPVAEDAVVEQLRRYVGDRRRLLHRVGRVFDAPEAAVAARRRQGLTADAAELLAMRNLRTVDGGYTWRTDPRLLGASAVKLTAGQGEAILRALTMPTLILLATSAAETSAAVAAAGQTLPDARVVTIEGGHHFHMESGMTGLMEHLGPFLDLPGQGEAD